ncbi:MAG: DedA family protein [Acidobacteria bacterium]|nr:DedA family protein [Acidobacteriota bacterium]
MSFFRHLKAYLLAWGVPGLFLIAFLDSAAVPMVGGPDAVVLLLCWQQPSHMPLIVLAAAIGSTLGCAVLYYIGRAGGELVLERFHMERRLWVKANIDRNTIWAVMVAVLAPPPFPTKLVILAAGAFGVGLGKFIVGVLAGRLIRYSIEGYLGARIGGQAVRVLKAQYPIISLVLIACVVLFLLIRRVRRPHEAVMDVHASPRQD